MSKNDIPNFLYSPGVRLISQSKTFVIKDSFSPCHVRRISYQKVLGGFGISMTTMIEKRGGGMRPPHQRDPHRQCAGRTVQARRRTKDTSKNYKKRGTKVCPCCICTVQSSLPFLEGPRLQNSRKVTICNLEEVIRSSYGAKR